MRDLEPTLHARGPKESGRQLPWYTYGKTYGPFVLEVLPLPIVPEEKSHPRKG